MEIVHVVASRDLRVEMIGLSFNHYASGGAGEIHHNSNPLKHLKDAHPAIRTESDSPAARNPAQSTATALDLEDEDEKRAVNLGLLQSLAIRGTGYIILGLLGFSRFLRTMWPTNPSLPWQSL